LRIFLMQSLPTIMPDAAHIGTAKAAGELLP
jgi:hypothetical protein